MSLRSCSTFLIPVVDVAGSIAKARTAILNAGGTINGDDEQGRFSGDSPLGKIEGTYATFADSIAVTILRKPIMVSCSVIRDRVRGYFG